MPILSIISDTFWLICRWLKIVDNPVNKFEKDKEENSKIIANHDAAALNSKLDDDCNRL